MKTFKLALVQIVLFPALMGCSATSLQCEVDGESSYINLNTNQPIQTRDLAELCSFNLETP